MESWQKIIKLNEVDSTNKYLSNLTKNTALAEGTIIAASHQKAGKGYGVNSWESEKDKNILISILLLPKFLPVEKNFLLSKAVSLGIVNYVSSKTNGIKIKWPNDIYYKEKKLAGILIENIVKGNQINQSIVGIGLNINQRTFRSEAPNPVSLNQITQRKYCVDEEIKKLRNCIQFFYNKLKVGKYNEINSDYLKYLYRHNEVHIFKFDNQCFKAKITGITEFGYLEVLTEKEEIRTFDFKEIEFVI